MLAYKVVGVRDRVLVSAYELHHRLEYHPGWRTVPELGELFVFTNFFAAQLYTLLTTSEVQLWTCECNHITPLEFSPASSLVYKMFWYYFYKGIVPHFSTPDLFVTPAGTAVTGWVKLVKRLL